MDYLPIRLATLRSGVPFEFDLFVKVNEKFIHYIQVGDDIELERLEKLRKFEGERVFIKKDDLQVYNEFVNMVLDKVVESDDVDLDEKCEVVEDVAETAIEVLTEMYDDPDSLEAFKMARTAAKGLSSVIQKNPNALKKLFHRKGFDTDFLVNHCKNVSALATHMAWKMGFRDEDLDDISAAALVHDMGIVKMERDEQTMLFPKKKELFSPDDRRIYNLHAEDSVKMIAEKPFINEKILNMVKYHEENIGGTGPRRKKDIDDLTQILSFANRYDKILIEYQCDHIKGLKLLKTNEVGNYDLKMIKTLHKVLIAEGIIEE